VEKLAKTKPQFSNYHTARRRHNSDQGNNKNNNPSVRLQYIDSNSLQSSRYQNCLQKANVKIGTLF